MWLAGRTRFNRLYLIGSSSTVLYPDALKAAIAEAKNGSDVQQYEQAVSMLHELDPSNREFTPDLAWISHVKKQTKVETDKLEMELKGYKNNLIKESIRVSPVLSFFSRETLRTEYTCRWATMTSVNTTNV